MTACKEASPCDDGQTLRDGYCYVVDAAVAADAVVSMKDGDVAGGEAGAASAFGKVCATSAECVAPAVYCAVQPGQAAGFCSAFGCDLDASVCPSGWGCMDLTPFGMPQHMCIPGS
jgi:hypothetical protein